jgi:hypothetical protein
MESTQEVPSENTAIDIANVSDTSFGSDIEKNSKINESADWQKKQDSLRNVILEGKPNEILKNSFLQEMYIRNVASVIKDCVFVNIPFDVHGPDCGAPDCYTTEISFSIKINDSLLFPENLKFQEHEYGCVDNEQKLSGTFQ